EGLVGAAPQCARHHFFGMAQPIDCGRIDPVQAGVQSGVNGGNGFVVVLRSPGESPPPTAHGPCANADRREFEVARAQTFRLHMQYSMMLLRGQMTRVSFAALIAWPRWRWVCSAMCVSSPITVVG